MELSFVTHSADGYTVLEVGGEMDVYTAPQLRERLIEIVEEGRRYLVVDLRRLEFLDSTGLGVLVGGLKRLRGVEGAFALVCGQERLLRIFRITGLDQVFSIHESVEAAVGEPLRPPPDPVANAAQPKTRRSSRTGRNRPAAEKKQPAATHRTAAPASRPAVEVAKPSKRTPVRRPSPTSPPTPEEAGRESTAIRVVVVRRSGGGPVEFAGEPGIEVVGVADDVASTADLVVAVEPAVAVIEVDLPDGSGLDLARALRASRRALGIVMISTQGGDEVLLGALDAGASAFVVTDSTSGTLVSAVRHSAAAPHRFTAEGLAGAVARRLAS